MRRTDNRKVFLLLLERLAFCPLWSINSELISEKWWYSDSQYGSLDSRSGNGEASFKCRGQKKHKKRLHPFLKWDSNPDLNIRDIESSKHLEPPARLLSLCHNKVFCLLSQIILLHLASPYSQLWFHNNTVRWYPNLCSYNVLFTTCYMIRPKRSLSGFIYITVVFNHVFVSQQLPTNHK